MNTVLQPSFYLLLLVYGFEWIGSLGHRKWEVCTTYLFYICVYVCIFRCYLSTYDRFHQIQVKCESRNRYFAAASCHTTISCSIGFVGTVLSSHDNGAKRGSNEIQSPCPPLPLYLLKHPTMKQRSLFHFVLVLSWVQGVWGFLAVRTSKCTKPIHAAPQRLEENVAGPLFVNEKVSLVG